MHSNVLSVSVGPQICDNLRAGCSQFRSLCVVPQYFYNSLFKSGGWTSPFTSQLPTDRFSPDELREMRFGDNAEAFRVLRSMALGAGFDIAARQSKSSEYGEFRCRKGGRVKGGTTGKCDCPFLIKTSPSPFGGIYIRLDDSLCLTHNHALEPDHYAHLLLPTDVEDMIAELSRSGIKPVQIMKFLEARGLRLSSLQVQWITKRHRVLDFENETEQLELMMKGLDGSFVKFYRATVANEEHRWGALTCTGTELENLKAYGDVIFLDGTYCNLKKKWEVVPITCITTDGNLASGGIFYGAMSNEMVYKWLLSELWELRMRDGGVRWRTVVTDEDTAFVAAFREFNLWALRNGHNTFLRHVLCAFHKERNFDSQLVRCGMSKSERGRAKELFKDICYCPHRGHVDTCTAELRSMNAKLGKYMSKEIDPLLGNFSRAYLSDVHALGFNTTSPAESMNRLLKHGLSGIPSLVASRRHFVTVLHDHDQNVVLKLARRRHPVIAKGWVPSDLYRFIGRKTADAIMHECRQRNRIEITLKQGQWVGEFSPQSLAPQDIARLVFLARDMDKRDLVYELTINACQCGLLQFRGIPCSHILQLYEKLCMEFPKHLIHCRWCRNVDTDEGAAPYAEGLDISDESQEAQAPKEDTDSSKQRYNVVFGLAKQIASRASRNKEVAERCIRTLRGLLHEMIELPPEDASEYTDESAPRNQEPRDIVDVVDAIGRPKGRPRTKRLGRG